MEIITKKVKELKPYQKNPRRNDEAVDYVAESIREFGFKVPIVIDKDDTIVCGHTRWKACKKLNIDEVPCVVADDLTDEQIKAFRLADNKVSEMADWDYSLLEEEMKDIISIDLEDFGFNINFADDTQEEEDEIKQKEKVRTAEAYNMELFDEELADGKWQMPIIRNDHFIPSKLIPFNYAKTNEEKNVGIHFYKDDYQFERLWNNPADYIDVLRQYECMFTPDFSLYTEMALPVKLWNVYRSRLLGQYYQNCGIKVIPTVSWCEEATFEWCFDGIPKGSIVTVSTMGVKREDEAFMIWKNGMDAMIEHIRPKTILVYGGKLDYDYGNIEVIYYQNDNIERLKDKVKKG